MPDATAPPAGNAPRVLPLSFEKALTHVNPKDYRYLETIICNLPVTKDLLHVAMFVDTILLASRAAENRTGDARMRGAEMDTYRDRLAAAMKNILTICVEIAVRAGCTDKIRYTSHRRMFARHGLSANAMTRAAKARLNKKAAEATAPETNAAGPQAGEAA